MLRTAIIAGFIFLTAAFAGTTALGQVIPGQDPRPPMFDVIVLKNGDLIYGLVTEVNTDYVKYRRTDIPDGPVYTIPRNTIYVISYRNQVKDFLDNTERKDLPRHRYHGYPSYNKPFNSSLLQNFNILAAVGFIGKYTNVSNDEDYNSKSTFPVLSFAYEGFLNRSVWLGLQVAFGSNKFTRQEFSSYDSTFTDILLKEKIFTLHVYGKYHLSLSDARVQPYVTGGIGVQSSNLTSDYTLRFLSSSQQAVLVKGGGRSVNLGVLLRAGTTVGLTDNLFAFADAGLGPTILQVGLGIQVDNKKR